MFSILGLILSLIIIMYLAYKGYSTIITAPIIAIITIILTTGFNGHLMANYTEVYMSGFANFIKNYFPLFMTGAIFAKLMEEANYAKSIAHFITQKLGKDKSILAVVLSGALLTYGGVSLFVVAFKVVSKTKLSKTGSASVAPIFAVLIVIAGISFIKYRKNNK